MIVLKKLAVLTNIHYSELIILFPHFTVSLFHCCDVYLNTGFYQGICNLSLFLGSLFLCWHADTDFLLSLCTQSTNKCTTLTFLNSAECGFCICVTILKACVYIHLLLCGLLPATHGRARQLNTGGNCHSVCLWNPNVSSKGWDPELWNNVKAHCVCSAGEMSATYSEWRLERRLACNVTLAKLDYKCIIFELQFEMHLFRGHSLRVSRH